MQDYPNYYNDILNSYPDYIPSLFDKTIENDLNRTFPDEEFFKDKENINKIRNILIAFSRRNSSIGYTQGFNFIVGRLLSVIKNEVRSSIQGIVIISSKVDSLLQLRHLPILNSIFLTH